MHRPHLIVLGGFLGAGKTSTVVALSEWLADQGMHMACIANDQGEDLVDTTMLRACGLATEEITGGCFCCRFDALLGATSRLGSAMQPDVIVAEAVGSCTDLAATVASPMRRLAGNTMTVAPLSVVVDAVHARAVFGLDAGAGQAPDVTYLYTKQTEEADLIAVNKCDLLTPTAVDELVAELQRRAPAAAIFRVSVRERVGLGTWFNDMLYGAPHPRTPLDIDYQRYAAGEAALGWLNASFDVSAPGPGDGNDLLMSVMTALHRELRNRDVAVAHLKMILGDARQLHRPLLPSKARDLLFAHRSSPRQVPHSVRDEESAVAAIQLTSTDGKPEVSSRLIRLVERGRIVVNLRAEATPELLEQLVRALPSSIEHRAVSWRLEIDHVDAFQPSPPVPTHRDA